MEFTSTQIEKLLGKAEYSPVARMDKNSLTREQKQEVSSVEQIVSFGQATINLFDALVTKLQTLPTQSQYVEEALPLMLAWLECKR